MDYIGVIIQGVIQGLTEFLPVSSSGHLSVAQHFMNVGEESLIVSVVLHLGTLVAVMIAFFPTIWGMIKEFFLTIRDICTRRFSWKDMNANRRMMFMVIIATALLVPVYLFKDFFTSFEGDGDIIFEGVAFLFTAVLLFMSDKCVKGNKTGDKMKVGDAIAVGAMQCVALFPGVSRSGSTTATGMFCGLTRETALTFSFILGIPAILGGSVLEIGDALQSEAQLDWLALGIGFVVAAVVGILAIFLVKLLIKKDLFRIFGIYTALLGLGCVGIGIYELATGTHFIVVF
ncbi:MAG: undecaprenyl-diphosphate phosphatase [Eubacterium sp.]|nr:undecaprenyl-diphosphate phosphatase [Eubacterium sp.]